MTPGDAPQSLNAIARSARASVPRPASRPARRSPRCGAAAGGSTSASPPAPRPGPPGWYLRLRHGTATEAAPSASTRRPLRRLLLLVRLLEPARPGARAPASYTLDGADRQLLRPPPLPPSSQSRNQSPRAYPHGLRHTYAAEAADERTLDLEHHRVPARRLDLVITDRDLRDVAPEGVYGEVQHLLTGWTVEMVAPAETAWAAAAIALWPPFARQNAYALIAHDDRTDLLQIEDGRLIGVRRFRAEGSGRADDRWTPWARQRASALPDRRRGGASCRLALAALGLTVVGAERRMVRRGRSSGSSRRAFRGQRDRSGAAQRGRASNAGGPACGARRGSLPVLRRHCSSSRPESSCGASITSSNTVRAEREQLKPQIASTMVGRNTVDAAYRHLATLSGIERASPHGRSSSPT